MVAACCFACLAYVKSRRRCALADFPLREIMKRHPRTKDTLSHYRAEVDADDGLDPRDFIKSQNQPRGAGRKMQQLCAQVAETLQQVLGEATDPAIQLLQVVAVAPAPDASQLLVLLAPVVATADFDLAATTDALRIATGWLRSQVASSITRKRAPQLVFRVLPAAPRKDVQP
jgi:ribosome-binding factor A